MEALQDGIFRYLVKFTVVENYFKRIRPLTRWYADSTENHAIVAPLIVRDVPGTRQAVRQTLHFQTINQDLKNIFIAEAHLDGAYVIQGRMISGKVILHGLVSNALEKMKLNSVDEMVAKYLPQDFAKQEQGRSPVELVGSKTLNAMAAGLIGGTGYAVKQTVVNSTGLGKAVMFDQDGLKAEFYLEPAGNYPKQEYIDPVRRVVGVLRVHDVEKKAWMKTIITPKQLGLDIGRYMNLGDKVVGAVNNFLKIAVK